VQTLAAYSSEPLAPVWFIVPITSIAFLIIGAHLLSMLQTQMPASRRRIRIANSSLMLISLPLLAYALAFVSPTNARVFTVCWMSLVLLIVLILVLAWLDVANNFRLARLERAAIAKETIQALRISSTQQG
jgi:hypothetical protein